MKQIIGYEQVNEAGEFKSLPKGIYGLKITDVVDKSENEYLEVYVDIAKGEFENYFSNLKAATGSDYSRVIRSYKQNALPFFKAFITAVEKSNTGYTWNWDEKSLIGKYVIGVYGEEEYLKDDEVKVSVKLQEFRSIQAFKEGKIKVPELKKLPESVKVPATNSVPVDVEDLPF